MLNYQTLSKIEYIRTFANLLETEEKKSIALIGPTNLKLRDVSIAKSAQRVTFVIIVYNIFFHKCLHSSLCKSSHTTK